MTDATATTGRTVLRGGFWYTASRLVPQFYTLAISIVAARFLGPEGMGRQSFIAFVELSLVAVLSNGMFFALMRWVGESVGRRSAASLGAVLRWAWGATAILGAIGSTVLVLAGLLGADPRSAWMLAAAVCFTGTLHAVPTAVLIGLQLWRQASIVGIVTGFVGTAAVIAVLSAGGGITGMFAVEAVISVVNLVWTSTLARRSLQLDEAPGAVGLDLRGAVVRAAAVLTLSEVLVLVVERRSEVLFLAHFSGDAQIALYSIVFSVVLALLQLPLAMAAAVSPAVATLYGAGDLDRIRSGYGRAVRLLLIGVALLTALGLALGPTLVRVIYGDDYSGTRPVLLVMMAAFPVMALSGVANSLLTGLGKLRALLAASACAAAVDIGLAAALVPVHDAVGAAIANVGAQVVLMLILLAAAHTWLGRIRWEQNVLIRATFAAAVAGLVAWGALEVLPDIAGLIAGLAAAAIAYTVVGATVKILAADDAVWLDETAGRLLNGLVGRLARAFARPGGDMSLLASSTRGRGN